MDSDNEITIVIPAYNDWTSLAQLLDQVDRALSAEGRPARVLVIDDASSLAVPDRWLGGTAFERIVEVDILRLRRNLGAQRAICIALAYLAAEPRSTTVIVMDADGEDDPAYFGSLLAEYEANDRAAIVFGERTKRSEGPIFRLGYRTYRYLFRILVGVRVRFGNYSVLGQAHVKALSAVPELWSHYAAAIISSRLQFTTVPTERATRLAGRSSMNLTALTVHGLSALAAFSDRIGARALLASLLGLLLIGCAFVVVMGIRLFTDLAVPNWATLSAGLTLVIGVQLVSFIFSFCFTVLASRHASAFLPARDYRYFIDRVDRAH